MDKYNTYSGIVIVYGGSIFVDFKGHPNPWIYIPLNMLQRYDYL